MGLVLVFVTVILAANALLGVALVIGYQNERHRLSSDLALWSDELGWPKPG